MKSNVCVALVSFLLFACGPPTSGDAGGAGGGRGGSDCAVHTECDPDQRCENGFCLDPAGCQQNSDCADNEACLDGACREASTSCEDIRDCPAGETCDNNVCVPQGAACTADPDCNRGETCTDGRCRPGDGTCGNDEDCPVGQSCRDGECLTTGGSECVRDTDCANAEVCDNGNCVPEGSCTSDRDCGLGEACQAGQCVPAGGANCSTHAQCQNGQICNIPSGQAAGTCQNLIGQTCRDDDDCDFRDSENSGTAGACQAGSCKIGQFGTCTGATDCADEYTCTAMQDRSLCLKACQDNSVCDSTLSCDSGLSRCWYNLCGQARELSTQFQTVRNGNLGGSCDADGTGDGTCVEVNAGADQWVGLCIEGGSQAVGRNCLFDTERSDDANQCVGGAYCHFNDDRLRGQCVASCSPEGSHGSVRCAGGLNCMAGRCLSEAQLCNPGTRDNCGPAGRCNVSNWEQEQGLCMVQERNTVAVNADCQDSAQCLDGSICLSLGGAQSQCIAICRPVGGGETCPNGTTCRSIPDLSNNTIGGNWGLCTPAG
jgi:hypothetical protein